MQQQGVAIGSDIATRGTVVRLKSTGDVGSISDIGRCGLVSIRIPGKPILASRVFAPAELEVIRKEDVDEQ